MDHTEKKHADQARASSRRQQVLVAAASCFGRSGFHGASMAEISKAAGMSAGHIYNYFDGKDAIIAAFVQQNVERLSALMHDLRRRDDPLQAILDDAHLSVLDNLDPRHWRLLLEIYAEASRNPAIAVLVQEADRQVRVDLREIVQQGRTRRGLVSDDVMLDACIEAIIALFQGLHLRALHNPTLNPAALAQAFRLALLPLLLHR